MPRDTPAVIADSQDRTRMASVLITLKIMPESPEVDLKKLEGNASETITRYGAKVIKSEQEPVAFGLKALKIIIIMDEKKGDTEPLENQLKDIPGVQNVEVIDVRRAVG